jgi:uncharacterized protein YidB (DUF937 family)
MGLLDNIFGAGSGSAIPGGLTKPLMIALLASRYMSGGQKAPAGQEAPISPDATDEISPGTVAGGLGGLLKQFQDAGFGDIAKSWIGTGPNEPAAPRDIADALGPDVIDSLSQRTGLREIKSPQSCRRCSPKPSINLRQPVGCRLMRS